MNPFIEESVGKLYARFLPSAIISLLVSSVASLIDTIIVAYFMGPVAISAINICMPIYSVLNAIGVLVIGGAGTLYSQYLGKNDHENALKIFTLAGIVLGVLGTLYMLGGVLFTGQIVRLLGANDAVFDMARQYAKILFCFALVNILLPYLQTFLRIDLNPNLSMIAIIVCALVNLVLDVLFIGPFLSPKGFGTAGAAFATCIAYVVSFLVMMMHFFTGKHSLRLVKNSFHAGELRRMLTAGIPASVTLFGTAITMTVFNNFIITRGDHYGVGIGELYVSVYSVIVQVMTIAMAVYVGIAQCAQPIMAANFGAGRKDRVKEFFVTGLKIEVIANAVLMVVLFFAARTIANMFSMDTGAYDMTDVTVLAIRIFALSLIPSGINQMIQHVLQISNYVRQSTMVSLLAGTVFLIAGLYILAGFMLKGNPDALGVWLSFLFTQALTMVYAIAALRKLKNSIF